jgi:hypothetical protein
MEATEPKNNDKLKDKLFEKIYLVICLILFILIQFVTINYLKNKKCREKEISELKIDDYFEKGEITFTPTDDIESYLRYEFNLNNSNEATSTTDISHSFENYDLDNPKIYAKNIQITFKNEDGVETNINVNKDTFKIDNYINEISNIEVSMFSVGQLLNKQFNEEFVVPAFKSKYNLDKNCLQRLNYDYFLGTQNEDEIKLKLLDYQRKNYNISHIMVNILISIILFIILYNLLKNKLKKINITLSITNIFTIAILFILVLILNHLFLIKIYK